jgi:hypothetical protein
MPICLRVMATDFDKAGDFGGTGLTTSPPTVAGGTPPHLRHLFAESSLRDSEYFRPPGPRARCRLSGMSRSSLLEHGEAGDFRMIRVRQKGKQRGLILVETASFLRWLNSLPAETRPPKGDAK